RGGADDEHGPEKDVDRWGRKRTPEQDSEDEENQSDTERPAETVDQEGQESADPVTPEKRVGDPPVPEGDGRDGPRIGWMRCGIADALVRWRLSRGQRPQVSPNGCSLPTKSWLRGTWPRYNLSTIRTAATAGQGGTGDPPREVGHDPRQRQPTAG